VREEVQREVERRERGDDALREPLDGAPEALGARLEIDRQDLASGSSGLLRRERERDEAAVDLGFGEPEGLPRLGDDRVRELRPPAGDPAADLPERLRPLPGGHPPGRVERIPRLSDRA